MASSSPCKSIQSSSMRSSSRVDDIASTPASPPIQPIINYPATIFSGKTRSFSQAWYNDYPWLEYSVQANACLCYSCHPFGSGPGSKCDRLLQWWDLGIGNMPLVKVVCCLSTIVALHIGNQC